MYNVVSLYEHREMKPFWAIQGQIMIGIWIMKGASGSNLIHTFHLSLD